MMSFYWKNKSIIDTLQRLFLHGENIVIKALLEAGYNSGVCSLKHAVPAEEWVVLATRGVSIIRIALFAAEWSFPVAGLTGGR